MTNKEVIEYVQHTPHNTNPVILKQKLEQQDFENRADWNQNDENAANFIKNRPFYSKGQERITILQHTNIKPLTSTLNKIIYGASIDSLIQGAKYYVTFDGVEYECIAYNLDTYTLIGNASLRSSSEEDNGMPFVMSFGYDDDSMMMNYTNIYLADRTVSHTVKVEQNEKTILMREIEINQSREQLKSGLFRTFMWGEKYAVYLDNTRYELSPFFVLTYFDQEELAIGNPAILECGEDNGIPFAIHNRLDADGDYWYIDFIGSKNNEKETCSIIISVCNEAINSIDSKFLPCDLMFEVGCTGLGHPKFDPTKMTRPTIVSGSLETVLKKLANGEIPVVKVRYQGYMTGQNNTIFAYGNEFICEVSVYNTDIIFVHDIPSLRNKMTAQIAMNIDEPNDLEMKMGIYATSPSIIGIT